MDRSVASFFSGAGGLDLGFAQAGFNVVWANEFDSSIWRTYEANHAGTTLVKKSLVGLSSTDLPTGVTGVIGGPPCQSWSEAGTQRGSEDHRGQLFFVYAKQIVTLRPKFFLAENVSGIMFTKHRSALTSILQPLLDSGYNISFGLLNAHDYRVPQDRLRVIIVGYQFGDRDTFFRPPKPVPLSERLTLRHAIWDLVGKEKRAIEGYIADPDHIVLNAKGEIVYNHEYLERGGFSQIFKSRNRVRSYDEPSFTIQAGGRHAPLHPQAPPMIKDLHHRDLFHFDPTVDESIYRRISVREAARIQTFPDDFRFFYSRVADGYKMIGNAVPVEFARRLASRIKSDLNKYGNTRAGKRSGRLVSFAEL